MYPLMARRSRNVTWIDFKFSEGKNGYQSTRWKWNIFYSNLYHIYFRIYEYFCLVRVERIFVWIYTRINNNLNKVFLGNLWKYQSNFVLFDREFLFLGESRWLFSYFRSTNHFQRHKWRWMIEYELNTEKWHRCEFHCNERKIKSKNSTNNLLEH